MINSIISFLTKGERAGADTQSVDDLYYRSKFSDFVTWSVYDPDTLIYMNNDGTSGYLFSCTPIVFSSEKTLQITEGLLRLPLPPHSVLQMVVHANPDISSILNRYKSCRNYNDPLIKSVTDSYCQHLVDGAKGIPQLAGIPVRDINLLVSVRFPSDDNKINRDELFSILREVLAGAGLCPEPMPPELLLEWARKLFNDNVPSGVDPSTQVPIVQSYDGNRPINTQIFSAETSVENIGGGYVQIGNKWWRSMTPKQLPSNTDPLKIKELFGGIWGVRSDIDQHKVPFLYAFNIIFDSLGKPLRQKCEAVLQQGAAGSWARGLARKQEEYTWCMDKFEQGEVFAHVLPVFWLYSDDLQKLDDAYSRARRMWESTGFYMQEEKYIPITLLLASIPMNCRSSKEKLDMLERSFILPGDAICNLLPIQGGFSGTGEGALLFTDRCGQLCSFDIFSKMANNYNGYVAASSGAGKSFAINYMAANQFFSGTKIRIVDIGGSYEKMADVLGGKYLDFAKESDICINPFNNIIDPEEDIPAIATIVLQAIYSSNDSPTIPEEERQLVRHAVKWAYVKGGNNADFDMVYDFLSNYHQYVEESHDAVLAGIARRLAFNMTEFTSNGAYGAMFKGNSNYFDIASEDFLVLELEALAQKKDLFKVVTLLILDAVQKDLYLSDRASKRMVIFDEAWQFLNDSGGNTMLRDMIESGYRRARKYHGSFFVITQSVLDRLRFGSIGDIIWSNADYKFLLQSPDYGKAKDAKLIEYDNFTVELLKTVASNKPKYSEIFVDTPFGTGIVRLAVDDFSYFLYSSDPVEVSEMKGYVNNGMSWRDAINEMVRKYR